MTPAVAQALQAQKSGADPEASAFVAANAGSGKTRVLVDRVARLLLAGAAPARILCLTFTKAAASEMQDRLYQRLGGWTIRDDDALRAELGALTGSPPDELGGLDRARTLFARALDTPGGLKVQTIHAFCEALLRRFPVEAGLDPGFTVLEAAETARMHALARRDAARAAETDADLAAAFAQIAAERDEASAEKLFAWLTDRRHRLEALLEDSGGLDGVLRAMRARLGLAAGDTADSIAAQAWADTPQQNLAAAADAMMDGGARDAERAAGLRAALIEPDPAAAWALYLAAVRTQKGERYAGGLCSAGVAKAAPFIADLFGAKGAPGSECARIDAVQAALNAAACADRTEAALRIGAAYVGAYQARKAAARGLDFSDLIHRARALLADSAAADWVRYKLDGGVDHILVDEAQDNSPDQWAIVDAMGAEFFSGAGAAEDVRTLFAVGDEKQSIFSFQGADPAEFRRAGQHYSALAHAAGLTFHAPPLETSFRSAPAILQAVDAVFAARGAAARFEAAAEADLPEGETETMRHIAFRDDRPGVVELWPAWAAAEPAEDGDPAAPVDAPAPDNPRLAVARTIAARIAEMIADRAGVWDKDTKAARAMTPGDALILVRRRDAFFEEMIRQLKLAGLPVAGADRMVLTDQTAVKDLLALARFALLPEDDLSLAELLKSPFFQPVGRGPAIDDDALFDLAWFRPNRLWEALRETQDPRFFEAREVLQDVLARVGVDAPYDFFARFLNRLAPEGASFARRLFARLGPEAEDPVEELLSRAMAHGRAGAPSLQRFVAELETEAAEIKREMEAGRDEVRVMTVHGAKGLEAPVVFLPDTTSYKRSGGDDGLFDDAECGLLWSPRKDADPPAAAGLRAEAERKQDAEYLRLLYVALTRARDHLIVAGWRMGPRGAKNPEGRIDEGCWHELVQGGLEIAGAEEFDTPAGPGLRLGAPPEAAEAAAEAGAADAIPDWARRTLPAEAGGRSAAPSRLLDGADGSAASSPLSGTAERRYRRGSLIHKLLELLPAIAPGGRKDAARAWLARQAGLDDAAQTEIAAAALRVLTDPEFAEVFGPGSRAEAPVTGKLPGGRVLNGAVDRLVVGPDRVLIVDYKTNRPPPADIGAADPAYIAQMAAYRALLGRIFPDRSVRCALLWTDAPALMEVPAAMMDAALDDLG